MKNINKNSCCGLALRAVCVSLLMVMILLLAPLCIPSLAAPMTTSEIERQIKAEEKRLKLLESRIAEARKKQQEAAKTEKKVIGDINYLSSEMSKMEQQLKVSLLRRSKVQGKLSNTVAEISTTSKRIEDVKKLLSKRLVAMYKYGGIAEFSLFMSAGGAQDALSTSYLLAKIAEQDRALINDLATQKVRLNRSKESLVKQKAELEQHNRQLQGQKTSIQRTTQERNRLLAQTRKDKALFQAQEEELLRASKDLQRKVTSLLAAKKKQQELEKGRPTPNYYKGGRLAWPLRGKINSPYGYRVHPVFKTRTMHTGLDIDGNTGDPVRAAADGEVLYTGWLRGYGQVVVLDHGANLTTVYAHLSAITTSENAKVRVGEVIGKVGATGIATGSHLHFEVRVNGDTTDPMKYLQ